MAKYVDPEKLVSVTDVAREFGYHPNYLVRLAKEEKFLAWRVGKIWITTRDHISEYIQSAPPSSKPSRPRGPARKARNKQK